MQTLLAAAAVAAALSVNFAQDQGTSILAALLRLDGRLFNQLDGPLSTLSRTGRQRQLRRPQPAVPPLPAGHRLVVLDGALLLVDSEGFVVSGWPPEDAANDVDDLSARPSRRASRPVRERDSYFLSDRPESDFYMYWSPVRDSRSDGLQREAESDPLSHQPSIVTYAFDTPQRNKLEERSDPLEQHDPPAFIDAPGEPPLSNCGSPPVQVLPPPDGFLPWGPSAIQVQSQPPSEPEPGPEPEPEPEPEPSSDDDGAKYSATPSDGSRGLRPAASHKHLPTTGSQLSSGWPHDKSDKDTGTLNTRGSYLPTVKKSSAGSFPSGAGQQLGAHRAALGLEPPVIDNGARPAASGARALTSLRPPVDDPSRLFFEQLGAQVAAELGVATEGRVRPQTQIVAELPDEVLSDLEEANHEDGRLDVGGGKPLTVVL